MGRIYLDWASAAPVHPKARKAFLDTVSKFGNPSASHAEGREAKAVLGEARSTVARISGVKPEHVIFTSGATEANALAIQGTAKASSRPCHMLYLPTAHSSITETMHALSEYGVVIEEIALKNGAVDNGKLKRQVRPETKLVSVVAVCSETGARYDTRAIKDAIGSVPLHVDASQLPLVESFELTRLKADLMTLDAQKIGGVRGAGALVTARSTSLLPLQYGGGQEAGLRSGSEPTALLASFAAALRVCSEGRSAFSDRASLLRQLLLSLVRAIPDTLVNDGARQVPHILNLSLLNRDTDYLVALLDEAGFAVSTKSACETDSTGSRVIERMYGDPDRARSTLRISFGPSTRERDIRRFAGALTTAVSFLDSHRV